MADYEFILPFPPSVNGYWKPFRNRIILSKRGREYRKAAVSAMNEYGLINENLSCKLSLSLILNPPTLRRYDADNFCKGVLDALTHSCFWLDDEQVNELHIKKGEKVKGGNILIKVNLLE